MANAPSSSSIPNQYMSGRGRYWAVIQDPNWPGLTARRYDKTKKLTTLVAPILAKDFASLATAIEKFETDTAESNEKSAYYDNNDNLIQPTVRGSYWHIVEVSPGSSLLNGRRLKSRNDLSISEGKEHVSFQAPDFAALMAKIDAFETDDAKLKSGMTNVPEGAMADSTKLMLAGLGIGVLGIGAYLLMRKSSDPSTVRYPASRPLAESDDEKKRRLLVLSDLEKSAYRLDHPDAQDIDEASVQRLRRRLDDSSPGYWASRMRNKKN